MQNSDQELTTKPAQVPLKGIIISVLAFVLAAIRSSQLLGLPTGLMLGSFLAVAVFCTIDAFQSRSQFAMIRRTLSIGLTLFVATLVIVPTWVSLDFQHVIDVNRREGTMRAELTKVFDSDVRFNRLKATVSTQKVTFVRLSGALEDEVAFIDARDAIRQQCPEVVAEGSVSWDVKILETGKRVVQNDGRLEN